MEQQRKRLIRMGEVEATTGLKRASVYELITRGEFPKPIKIGARAVAWVDGDVQEWIEDRIARATDRVVS